MAQGSPPGQLAASDVTVVVKSALWTLFAMVVGAALTALADGLITTVLPQLKDSGVLDATLFALLTTIIDAIRKAVQQWLKDTRPFVVLLLIGFFLAPADAMAEDLTVKLSGITRGQSYELTYNADGTIVVRPVVVVVVGGGPTAPPTTPPTTPPTVPNSVAAQVQALTAEALVGGGTHLTAAKLAGVYSVVADQVNAGTVQLNQISPALKSLSDSMIPSAEAAKWTKWRQGVGDMLTTRIGDKVTAVTSLRGVETGIISAVDGSARASGSPAVNWQELFRIILPIILELLLKLLNPMGAM